MKRVSLSIAVLVAALSIATVSYSADDDYGLGSGADGAFVATSKDQIVNAYVAVTSSASKGATMIGVADTSAFVAGDLVMVLQVKGGGPYVSTTTDPPPVIDLAAADVGQYDVVKVSAKTSSMLKVTPPLKNGYRATGAQVIRIPQYTTVSVPDGMSLTAKAWDGTTGGVVAFVAQGAVTMTGSAAVHADGKGLRGGAKSNYYAGAQLMVVDDLDCNLGRKGESFDEAAPECGVGARATGGGGGGGGGNLYAGSGGGGGNGGPGSRGKPGYTFTVPTGGYGGSAVDASLLERLTFGGGGGGGQQSLTRCNSPCPPSWPPAECEQLATSCATVVSRGGNGGGAVFIRAAELHSARVHADGDPGRHGGENFNSVTQGSGGGGAGGSILVRAVGVAEIAVSAAGGDVVYSSPLPGAGVGGAGRIFLQSRGGATSLTRDAGVVEDAGASMFGCGVEAGSCSSERPICDALTRVCRPCTAASECATGYCASDGRCREKPAAEAGVDESDAGSGVTPPSSNASPSTAGSAAPVATPPSNGASGGGASDVGGAGCACTTTSTSDRPGVAGSLLAIALAAAALLRRGSRDS